MGSSHIPLPTQAVGTLCLLQGPLAPKDWTTACLKSSREVVAAELCLTLQKGLGRGPPMSDGLGLDQRSIRHLRVLREETLATLLSGRGDSGLCSPEEPLGVVSGCILRHSRAWEQVLPSALNCGTGCVCVCGLPAIHFQPLPEQCISYPVANLEERNFRCLKAASATEKSARP